MNLKFLNRIELDQRIRSLVTKEKELLHDILQTIKEIDVRKLYLDFGYPNLFSYLTKALGYSEGSAQRRIDGARLLKELPEVGHLLHSGELKLSQVALVQKTARQVFKTQHRKVDTVQKKLLLEKLTNKNHADTQFEVSHFFALPSLQEIKTTKQSDESVRLEITLSKTLYDKITFAQQLLSHTIPSGDLVQYLDYVTEQLIKSKVGKSGYASDAISNQATAEESTTPQSFIHQQKVRPSSVIKSANSTATNPTPARNVSAVNTSEINKSHKSQSQSQSQSNSNSNSNSNYQKFRLPEVSQLKNHSENIYHHKLHRQFAVKSMVSGINRRNILKNQKCCQYKDPMTGKQCQSRWFLQIDHKHSRWAGGNDHLSNLQVLCGAHNRHKYLKETATKSIG